MRELAGNAEINVLVYAENNEELWSYREMIYSIREKKTYKVEITLTRFFSTFINVAEFLPGGVDLFCFMKQTGDKELVRLQELAKKQKRAFLVSCGKENLIWEYYQKEEKIGAERLVIRNMQEFRSIIEVLCDYLVEISQIPF